MKETDARREEADSKGNMNKILKGSEELPVIKRKSRKETNLSDSQS